MANQAIKLYKGNNDNDKRVGINLPANSTPQYGLDVNGSIQIRYNSQSTAWTAALTQPSIVKNINLSASTGYFPGIAWPTKEGTKTSWSIGTLVQNSDLYFVHNYDGANTERYVLPVDATNLKNAAYSILTDKDITNSSKVSALYAWGGSLGDQTDKNLDNYNYDNNRNGVWSSTGSTMSATLTNPPTTTSGFKMLSIRGYGSYRGHQIALGAAAAPYIRYETGTAGTWNNWGRLVVASTSGVGSSTSPVYISNNGIATACTGVMSHTHSGADITSGTVAAARLPSASTSAAGIVSTDSQNFAGAKGFYHLRLYANSNSGASRYNDILLYNNAGTQVGEIWYDIGNATNITTGKYYFRQYSPNSTANTSTTGHHETYTLPTVTVGRTTDATYNIITSKGGNMPSRFYVNQGYQPYFIFKPSNSTNNGHDTYGPASIWVNSSDSSHSTYVNQNKMYFRLYSPSKDDSTTTTYTSYYDQFALPEAEIGRTASGSYDILTTKNAVTIAQGGTGATTRLNALKALTNENVSTNANYFLTITSSWGKGGYTSVADAKTVLGITGTQYGSNHMGWKKVSITMTNGAGSVACTGVTADSVVQVTRVGTYSDTSGGYSTHIGAAATNAGNVKVFSTASGTVTWNVYIWWSKTATGGS